MSPSASDGAPPSPLAKKGTTGAHVPKAQWRAMRPKPPRADASPDVGLLGGPARGREVNGVFRTTSELEAACPHNLRMWGLPSQEAYFAEEDERRRARAALQAVVRDPLVAPEAKHHAQASYHARWGHSTRSCRGCWLAAGHCVCARLVSVDIAPHRVVVYAHHTEFGRGSSTGVLARACLGADVLVAGHRDHEAALARLCERNEGRVAVLWPRDAVDVREFVRNAAANEREGACGGEEAIGSDRGDDGSARAAGARDVTQLCAGPGKGGFVFVAVDGTWQCARKMLARLPPGIARVRVPPEAFRSVTSGGGEASPSLLAPVRKFNTATHPALEARRCTFEAVVALMRTLGHAESACEALLGCIKVKVDAVLAQKHMPSAYGHGGGEEARGATAEAPT